MLLNWLPGERETGMPVIPLLLVLLVVSVLVVDVVVAATAAPVRRPVSPEGVQDDGLGGLGRGRSLVGKPELLVFGVLAIHLFVAHVISEKGNQRNSILHSLSLESRNGRKCTKSFQLFQIF